MREITVLFTIGQGEKMAKQPDLKSTVAENLRWFRKQRGMTQAELATAAQVSSRYIASLETLPGQNLTLDTLQSLARALNIAVPDLILGRRHAEKSRADAIELAIEALQRLAKDLR